MFIVGFLREKCSGKVLSFTDANPKTLVQRIPGREGCRVYSADGLSITLTGTTGGFGGKTGLYEIIGLPIKVKTKSGYQIALPGDSIDLAYPNLNSRRGRVGKDMAHTITTSCNQGYYAMCIDMNPEPKVTELARCITSRQDSGIGHHKGEKSGVIWTTVKKEETDRRSYSSIEELKISIFKYIDGFYNSIRPHSHNNGLSPNDFEKL